MSGPTIHAPALPTDAVWLNVERPLTTGDLRGRVVVLDFWTYVCINCLHTLPVLAEVERRLDGEPVVVIGVHSPKFPTEGDPERVREALRRHGVTHPVVVDTAHGVWDAYAVRSWPTLVVIRPDGTIVGRSSGEPEVRPPEGLLRRLLEAHAEELDRDPLPIRPERAEAGQLAYPGGLAVGPDGTVYVADTAHHQVVVAGPDGSERARYGSGAPGLADGPSGSARFREPRGLDVDLLGPAGPRLLVADTGNHAVRAVDLSSGTVTTLAGTGRRAPGPSTGGPVGTTALRSPWDVVAAGPDRVLVAMAGSHQLWALTGAWTAAWAGSGREGRRDGPREAAALAQPSGLAVGSDAAVYVADSEISAVRRVTEDGVMTVAGGDLFDFGLRDGVGDEARFQHPVGLCLVDGGPLAGLLLVADTLNHAVRTLDPASGEVRTLLGDGTAFSAHLAELERRRGLPEDLRRASALSEPEAVAWDGTRVLVADTGNHRVVAVDPVTGRGEVLLGA